MADEREYQRAHTQYEESIGDIAADDITDR
jgi:hypothetical protein